MNALRSIAMAFAMFSRIPMPRIEWKKENMRYMLCALPLVGAAIGLALTLWVWVCLRLKMGQTLFVAGIALIPLLLSGGGKRAHKRAHGAAYHMHKPHYQRGIIA